MIACARFLEVRACLLEIHELPKVILAWQAHLLRALVTGGFDVTLVNASGNTALHLVCMVDGPDLNKWRLTKSCRVLSAH